ncbi:MAG: YdeI/OmpD-associated family protein [Ginsengibacter sp.]
MGKKDKRFDDYIAKSADFAKPILNHIRQLVHSTCPEVEENIKWSFPNFDYKGPFCSMAAFKEHCSFGFWKAAIMKDAEKLKTNQATSMGHLGKIKSLADLPPDKILIAYIKEAITLNDQGIKLPPRKKDTEKKELLIPDYFINSLKKNKDAYKIFEGFSPSHKKEYVEWITQAKTEETRNKRMAKALEQISESKGLNWKYQRVKDVTDKK